MECLVSGLSGNRFVLSHAAFCSKLICCCFLKSENVSRKDRKINSGSNQTIWHGYGVVRRKKKREESVQQGTDDREISLVDTISEKATEEENEYKIESALTSTLGNDYQNSFSIKTQPNQPRNITFPQRSFGNNNILKRSFQSTWFDKFKWLD